MRRFYTVERERAEREKSAPFQAKVAHWRPLFSAFRRSAGHSTRYRWIDTNEPCPCNRLLDVASFRADRCFYRRLLYVFVLFCMLFVVLFVATWRTMLRQCCLTCDTANSQSVLRHWKRRKLFVLPLSSSFRIIHKHSHLSHLHRQPLLPMQQQCPWTPSSSCCCPQVAIVCAVRTIRIVRAFRAVCVVCGRWCVHGNLTTHTHTAKIH